MVDERKCVNCVHFEVCAYVDPLLPVCDSYAEPVNHGYWKPVKLTRRTTEYKCSICGRWERTDKEPYCNCGAKMQGGNDHD